MGSFVISELPHPPNEKYSLAEPQHPLKVKYFLSADLTKLQGGNHDGNTHTTRHDPQDGLECRRQASCMGLLQGELEQYFIIAGTPNEAKVTHILFYGGKEASEWWTALKDQVEGNKDDSDTVFKAFANSFEKSSSHWQARDKYLSDIKQSKHQTMAELDIYIKDLIRRYQFPQEDQESRKIDLLYHATAHFEVRKFVHNAKQEELKYDHMIEVAKAHERTCQEYQIHKQAHCVAPSSNSYCNPLLQTNALSKSFQKGPPRKTCGTGNALLTILHAVSVAIWITGLSNVEALGGGTVQLVAHPPWEGHRIDRDGSVVTSQTKVGDMEEAVASRNLLPKDQAVAMVEEEASPSKWIP